MNQNLPLGVTVPLLNPNEPDGRLVSVDVQEGQSVQAGQPLFTLETTKATAEMVAERAGFVIGLRVGQGQAVRAGDLVCYLSDDPDWKPGSIDFPDLGIPSGTNAVPDGLRITQPALALVRQHNLDLGKLPVGTLVTETTVRRLLETPGETARLGAPQTEFDPSAIIIYGGGGHGKSLIDLVRVLNVYRIMGVVDDSIPAGETIMGVPVLGGFDALTGLRAQGIRLAINAVGGIGAIQVRLQVFRRLLDAGFICPAVIHPRALVESSAAISPGVQVFSHTYVGSEAQIGYGCIVNTGAIVSHDCVLNDYANISPGAILAGEVQIGAGVLVGMGATVNLQVRIGAGARIGNGATVKEDVPENGVVRAGTIWPS